MSKKFLVVHDLMDALDAADVLYCHWKSNEHLQAGLEGETDIDMLVASEDADACREILRKQGWIFGDAPPFTEMEHWMGFDDITGKLFHIHLHTAGLPVGPSKRKIFTLPQAVSDWILESRVRQDGVWVAGPEAELFMLLLRITLKSTVRNLAGAYVRKRDVMPSTHLRRELRWLLERTSDGVHVDCPALPKKFSATLQAFLPIVKNESSSPLSYLPVMLKMRFMVLPYMTPYRIFARRKRGGKVLQSSTPVFAFVGVDGSGKSSQVKELRKWLGWKFNAQAFYLGTPKKSSFGRKFNRVTKKIPGTRIFFRFYAAYYRFSTAKRAHKEAQLGRIVLTDRYPIPALWGVTDGPRLKGFLCGLEQRLYRSVPDPGYMIVLRVPEEELRKRDTTIKPESRSLKVAGIATLDPQKSAFEMRVIDGSKSFDEVNLECRRLIFKKLQAVQNENLR